MKDKINVLISEALKARKKEILEVYKLIKAEFQKSEKSGKPWDETKVLFRMITTREDSAKQYREGGREDLAFQEEFEIKVIKDILPPQPTESEIIAEINRVIDEYGDITMKDTKAIISEVSKKYPGVSGKLVSNEIKKRLC